MIKPTKWAVATLVSLLSGSYTHAHTSTYSEIRYVDFKFRKAMTSSDVTLMESVVADDAKIIHGNDGGIQGKSGLISRFRTYHIEEYERDPILFKLSGNLAVLVSTTRKVSGSKTTETTTTEVFARRSGRWWIIVLQNTDHSRS